MSQAPTAALGHGGADISQAGLAVRQIHGLVVYTLRESMYRWTLITYLLGTTFFLLLMSTAVNLDIVEGTIASARLFGQDIQIGDEQIPIQDVVRWIQVGIVSTLYSIGVLFALFLTCNYIPAIAREGWVDLLVAQPVSRPTLLLGRTLGAITVVSIGVAYLVLGSWLILRVKTGLGSAGFLSAGLVILLVYTCCFAAIVLVGIVTGNAPVSGIIGLMVWIGGHVMYPFHVYSEWRVALPAGWRRQLATGVAEGLYWLLPKSEGLRQLAVDAARDQPVSLAPVFASLPFVALCLFVACWWFTRRDY